MAKRKNITKGENKIDTKNPLESKLDWEKLKKDLAPPARGLMAGPLSEEEQKQRLFQVNRQGLVDAMHIILETLPYVHPDWLLAEVGNLGDPELTNIARLQFIQLAMNNMGRLSQLQQALVQSEAKNLKDQGIDLPAAETFTLTNVLETLAQRLTPISSAKGVR